MGVNAQTSVPAFTAGQVLTAAEMTQVNTGIPVFATTVTRDAAFGGAGEKVLAQGQYAYIEATSTLQVYDGSAWQTAISSGMNLIKTQVIGTAVATVAITSAFSATYDAYRIVISGGLGSTANDIRLAFTGSTASYYGAVTGANYTTSAYTGLAINNAASWSYAGSCSTSSIMFDVTLVNPFLAKNTIISTGMHYNSGGAAYGRMTGEHLVASSFTGFDLSLAVAGTLTGGTIRIYGLANS